MIADVVIGADPWAVAGIDKGGVTLGALFGLAVVVVEHVIPHIFDQNVDAELGRRRQRLPNHVERARDDLVLGAVVAMTRDEKHRRGAAVA